MFRKLRTVGLAGAIAWVLPKKVVSWCAIRVLVVATTGEYNDTEVPALSAMDALMRFYPPAQHPPSFWIKIRLALLRPGSWKWNAWLRDWTAQMEAAAR